MQYENTFLITLKPPAERGGFFNPAGAPVKRARSFKICSQTQGFTLIEVLMVIALLGIISAVAVSQFVNFGDDAKKQVTLARLNELRMAIIGDPNLVSAGQYTNPGFISQVGSVPVALTDLTTQGAYTSYDPFLKKGWRGPYISTLEVNWNKDAWGIALVYNAGTRSIKSCGSNKVCGDADDITINF